MRKVGFDDKREAKLYCHSPAREQKDRAIDDAKSAAFEAQLGKLGDSLAKSAGGKTLDKIMEKVGRAKQRYACAAQHYRVRVVADEDVQGAVAIPWEKHVKPGGAGNLPA